MKTITFLRKVLNKYLTGKTNINKQIGKQINLFNTITILFMNRFSFWSFFFYLDCENGVLINFCL